MRLLFLVLLLVAAGCSADTGDSAVSQPLPATAEPEANPSPLPTPAPPQPTQSPLPTAAEPQPTQSPLPTSPPVTDDEPAGYDETIKSNFMSGCVAGAGDASLPFDLEAVCACAYDQFQDEIPFDDFQMFAEQLQDPASDVGALQDPIAIAASDFIDGCIATTSATEVNDTLDITQYRIDGSISDVAAIERFEAGEWAQVFRSPSDEVVWIDRLASGPTGLIAVGATRPPGQIYDVLEQRRPVAYYSNDGTNWAEAEIVGDFVGRGGVLNDVVWSSADSLYYAIGYDGVSGQDQRALLFSSPTGAAWKQVDWPFGTPEFDEKGQAIAATEVGLVAIGSAEYAPTPYAMLWIYDASSGWSRQDIATDEVFDTVDFYRECFRSDSQYLAGQNVMCPASG